MPVVIKSSEGTETDFRELESVFEGTLRDYNFKEDDSWVVLSEVLPNLEEGKTVLTYPGMGLGKSAQIVAGITDEVIHRTEWTHHLVSNTIRVRGIGRVLGITRVKMSDSATRSRIWPERFVTELPESTWELECRNNAFRLVQEAHDVIPLDFETYPHGSLASSWNSWIWHWDYPQTIDDEANTGATAVSEPEILLEVDVRFPPKRTRTMVGKVGKRERAKFKTAFGDELMDHGGSG